MNSLEKKAKSLKPIPLIGLIDQNHSDNSNFLNNIKIDLEIFVGNLDVQKPEFMMPILYAYRTAMAGLYTQGLLPKEEYEVADTSHHKMLFEIANLFSNEDQVYFQEKSFDYAIDFIQSYCSYFDKRTASLFVAAAKKGICLHEALFYALVNKVGDQEVCHTICHTLVTPQFCIGFFNSGIWDHSNDDLEKTIGKVNEFYNSILKNEIQNGM